MKNNGLFKYIVQITCILALSYAAQIYSLNIDLKQLFGTWQCLQDDKKHLSPLNGAICAETGWIENIYRFGEVDSEVVLKDGRQVFKKREESKRRIKQNATSELVFLLFNAFPNIDGIHVSKSPASPATVLTLALIGQLINEIEKLMGSGCSILFDLSNDDEFNGIIGDAKKAFEKSEESQNLLSKQKKLQSLLKEQKKAKKDPSIKEVPRETKQLGIKIAEIQKQLDLQSEQLVQKHITNKYEMLIKNDEQFL